MKKIITLLSISAILLSLTPIAKAQTNSSQTGATTLSGDSLKTVEGRSISNDDFRRYSTDYSESSNPPTSGIQNYELRRKQQNVEVIPGISIPVNPDESKSENPLEENTLEGDKSGKGFKLELGI